MLRVNKLNYNVALFSECPKEEPTGKCFGNLTCNYGKVCCCGECHPSLIAKCSNGQWSLLSLDGCADAGQDGSGCGSNY